MADLFGGDVLRDQADAILIKPVSPIQLQDLVTNLQTSRRTKLLNQTGDDLNDSAKSLDH